MTPGSSGTIKIINKPDINDLMKFNPLLYLVFLVTTILSAQQSKLLNVEESTLVPDKQNAVLVAYTETETNRAITVKLLPTHDQFGSYKFILSSLDPSMATVLVKEIDKPKKEEFLGYTQYQGKLTLFTSGDWKKKERNVYRYTINTDNLLHEKEEVFTIRTDKRTMVNSGVPLSPNPLSIVIPIFPKKKPLVNSEIYPTHTLMAASPNGRYATLISRNEQTAENIFTLRVIDNESGSLVQEKAFFKNNPSIKGDIVITDLMVDDLGKVYTVVKATGNFLLHEISQEAMRTVFYTDKAKRYIHTLKLEPGKNAHQLQMIGYYAEGNKAKTAGIINIPVDLQAQKTGTPIATPITNQIYKDIYGLGSGGKIIKKEPKNLFLDQILRDENGDLYAIGQRVWKSEGVAVPIMGTGIATGNAFPIIASARFGAGIYFGDILIYKFNANGALIWSKGIAKETTQSYTPSIINNELHIFFNAARLKSTKRKAGVKFSKALLKSSSLYHISFSKNGAMSHRVLYDNKSDYAFEPGTGIRSGNSTIIAGIKGSVARYNNTIQSVFMRISAPAEETATAEETNSGKNDE